MWHAMFAKQIPLAEKILRTVIVYAVIAMLFRLTGKRGLASRTALPRTDPTQATYDGNRARRANGRPNHSPAKTQKTKTVMITAGSPLAT
jgi:hypothetical protein